jgi:hypothetical protein
VATRAEAEFHRETVDGSQRLKKEIGYNPTRFLQMVADHGGPEAADSFSKVMTPPTASGHYGRLTVSR